MSLALGKNKSGRSKQFWHIQHSNSRAHAKDPAALPLHQMYACDGDARYSSRSSPPRPPHHRPAASEISQRPEPMSALCSYAVIFLINLHLMPLNFSASPLWCAGPPPLPLSATTWVHAHAGTMWATYQAGCRGRSCPCGQCSILPGRQRRVVASQADYGGSYTGASPPPSW